MNLNMNMKNDNKTESKRFHNGIDDATTDDGNLHK